MVNGLDPLAILIELDMWYHPLELTSLLAPYNDGENTVANLPSWYAGGITALFAVLILANDTPFVVPAPVCVIKDCEPDVEVSIFELLSLNLKVNEPETLSEVGVPLLNVPKPNNCESTEDDTIVVPDDTLVNVCP